MVARWANLSQEEQAALSVSSGLTPLMADQMIENVIGAYSFPLGVATNFLINGRDYLIPMVIEEPSVVAACSFAAKLARSGGGFITHSDEPVMIGQFQVLDTPDLATAAQAILDERQALLAEVNDPDLSIVKRGGGARDLEVRTFEQTPIGPMLVVHLLYDTRDAMGANAINTACEKLAPSIERITGGRVHLRILSNLSDRRLASATCTISAEALSTNDMPGSAVAQSIVEAAAFAEIDPYRATTHNKGVMNGIDAVVIATGNDWRAVEAGAHAYAARSGRYTSMTRWWKDEDGNLKGSLTLPMAVGIVGGATRVHPTAQLVLRILGVESARELAEVVVAVGLAQNLAAIRALATEGIQSGHMALHARQMALAAGATPDLAQRVAEAMIAEGAIRLERARALVKELAASAKW
jgi:hydroxymethylglutaryl-CoA reductase